MKNKKNLSFTSAFFVFLILFMISSCKKEDLGDLSVISTVAITNITDTTAVSGGTITSTGGTSITASGICWSLSSTPTIADSKTIETASGVGGYISAFKNLVPNSTYFVRAYVTNKAGTTYGEALSFKTLAKGTVLDVDGNVYHSVKIGLQTWMVENLKTTKYNDGTAIPNVTDAIAWDALTSGAYADYSNTSSNSNTYGKLYNYYTVVDARKLCPTGWHVPTDAEWSTLTTYLGGEIVAGGKLKEMGTTHWLTPNTAANNNSGFTAIPGGYRYSNGAYSGIGYDGHWWSSTESSTAYAWYRNVYYNTSYVLRDYNNKSCGYSVRCVRD